MKKQESQLNTYERHLTTLEDKNNELKKSLKAVINLAIVRTRGDESILNDVYELIEVSRFSKMSDVLNGIMAGSSGAYGINHKVTPQVFGYWIRKYIKDLE